MTVIPACNTWESIYFSYATAQCAGYGFPTTDCEAGLNHRIHFPACWDGKVHTLRRLLFAERLLIHYWTQNLDSPNHKDHVAYLSLMDNGSCPPTHPVGLMKLFFEVFSILNWNTYSLIN